MAGHDKTTAAGKKLFKELKELSEMQVRVGFQRGKNTRKKENAQALILWTSLCITSLAPIHSIPSFSCTDGSPAGGCH